MRLLELFDHVVRVQAHRDRTETQHRLPAEHNGVLPEHVVPPRRWSEMDSAVDFDGEGVEVGIQIASAARAIDPYDLSAWWQDSGPPRQLDEVELKQRVRAAFDVRGDRKVESPTRQRRLGRHERDKLVGRK